jgi:predicted glycosyltransferase
MILIASGTRDASSFDASLVLAAQVEALGHAVALDARSLPEGVGRATLFQAARWLTDPDDLAPDAILVIGAGRVEDAVLADLRTLNLHAGVPVRAFGRFADRQAQIQARARLSYALGAEPEVTDLGRADPNPLDPAADVPVLAVAGPGRPAVAGRTRVAVALGAGELSDPGLLAALAVLAHQPAIDLAIWADDAPAGALPAPLWRPSDLDPLTLAGRTDILVLLPDAEAVSAPLSLRLAAAAGALLAGGGLVVDATPDARFAASGAPVLRGPAEAAAIAPFLTTTLLPNRETIRARIKAGPWLAAHGGDGLGLPPAPLRAALPPAPPPDQRDILFLPTNGVGLGHAQRLSRIAGALTRPDRAVFAAFPSCLPMIEAAGFPALPLVSKSPVHVTPFANDLLNARRLARHAPEGGTLVFDGGYVFPSIQRTILEQRMRGVWVRRGLWQPHHLTGDMAEREAVFDRILIPAEAFDELNDRYSFGPRIHPIGPVVQEGVVEDRASVRARLAAATGVVADRIVLSMLGSGVVTDRLAHLQLIAALIEGRPGWQHLVLVWPGSQVDPALYGWRQTQVVASRDALSLAAAADVVVSAAGYNSVHELLYHGIPAIFVPQVAAVMDDQDRRSRAAAERGLAERVEPRELLRLERLVLAMAGARGDEIRAALAAHAFPARGQAEAARLIAEVADG